jgi:DNA-binding PadR family transcriptional regulator
LTKRPVNNLLALAVLAYLTQRPMHPYELSRTLRDNGDARSIRFTHGSLYMVVGQLARAGLITPAGTGREGQRPERTLYALTDAGHAELREWMRDLVREPQHEYPHFIAALSLIGALHPDDVTVLLRERLNRLGQQRADAQAVIASAHQAGVHPLFLIEEEYRITLLDAEVAFVERFLQKITGPATDWAADWAAFHAMHPSAQRLTQEGQ